MVKSRRLEGESGWKHSGDVRRNFWSGNLTSAYQLVVNTDGSGSGINSVDLGNQHQGATASLRARPGRQVALLLLMRSASFNMSQRIADCCHFRRCADYNLREENDYNNQHRSERAYREFNSSQREFTRTRNMPALP